MTTAQQFRKKPVVIEAMQWDGTAAGATAIIDWVLGGGGTARYACGQPDSGPYKPEKPHTLAIDTLEGSMHATAGDWIIRGVQGEFYPCKPDIFASTYGEAAEEVHPESVGHLLDIYRRCRQGRTFGNAETVMDCIIEDLQKLVDVSAAATVPGTVGR